MGAVVSANYGQWLQKFPEFGRVTENQYMGYWSDATIFLRNDGTSPVQDPNQQASLLGLITAHLVKLNVGTPDGTASPGTQLVGRVASATQGGVSVSTDLPTVASQAWWAQTQYGLSYYQASAPFRLMYYRGPRRRGRGYWPFGR
jgi:hypothetical protein